MRVSVIVTSLTRCTYVQSCQIGLRFTSWTQQTYNREWVMTYIVSQKSTPHKTFCNIFTYAQNFSVKFCQFVAVLYPHVDTNFGRRTLISTKWSLIFLGVLIVFTVSSFEFQQVRLPWLHRYDEWSPIHPTSIQLYYQIWGQCWSLKTSWHIAWILLDGQQERNSGAENTQCCNWYESYSFIWPLNT